MKKIAVFLLSLNSFGFAALAQVNLQPAIKAYLSENSDELGLELTDFQAITITDQNVSRTSGVKHVYVAQEIDGVILKNGVANFAIDPEGNIVHSGVRLISNLDKKSRFIESDRLCGRSNFKCKIGYWYGRRGGRLFERNRNRSSQF
jgi:hypothetical protein